MDAAATLHNLRHLLFPLSHQLGTRSTQVEQDQCSQRSSDQQPDTHLQNTQETKVGVFSDNE
jgi:hypothetical protein